MKMITLASLKDEIATNTLPSNSIDIKTRGFIETIRFKGKLLFILLRDSTEKLQLVSKVDSPLPLSTLKEYALTPPESFIEVSGSLAVSKIEVKSATIKTHELCISSLTVLSRSVPDAIPFHLTDIEAPLAASFSFSDRYSRSSLSLSSLPEEGPSDDTRSKPKVSKALRLNNRAFDLRLRENQLIFLLRSQILISLRESFHAIAPFPVTEVNTPKLLSAATESGAEVFKVDYFGRDAYLAQSPQLFKQMLVIGGFPGVLEVGPVFRAEKNHTNRHLAEFTGVDFEMRLREGSAEVVGLVWAALRRTVQELGERARGILAELHAFSEKHCLSRVRVARGGGEAELLPAVPEEPVVLTFCEAKALLGKAAPNACAKAQGEAEVEEDLSAEEELAIGRLAKEKFGSDLVVITEYPRALRAFYTKKKDEQTSFGFDFLLFGEEIISGAERETDLRVLRENLARIGVGEDDPGLKYYLECFRLGVPRHGGVGLGLDRFVGLLAGLRNCKDAVLFSRDARRLEP